MKLLTEKQKEREQRGQKIVEVYHNLAVLCPEASVSRIIAHMASREIAGYRSKAGIRKVLLRSGVDVTRRKQA